VFFVKEMSVRNETRSSSVFTGVNSEIATDALATISAAQNVDTTLSEANDFSTNNQEHPLKRTLVVSVRASLEDLCLRKAKASWTPSCEATATILKQKKFVDLQGNTEKQGDLNVCSMGTCCVCVCVCVCVCCVVLLSCTS
jgi:hypothetical protein